MVEVIQPPYIVYAENFENVLNAHTGFHVRRLAKRLFRANRQFILSADAIRSIEPYFHGKVILKVSPSFDGLVIISKEKITPLKMWLNS